MTPYITYRERGRGGRLQYFVLQKDFPHIVGEIVDSPPEGGMGFSTISGYNLWVVFGGTLRGNFIPTYRNILDEIQGVLDNMAAWFFSERIVPDEKKFHRFKIGTNGTIALK